MFRYGFNSGDLAMNYRIFKLSLVKFTVNRHGSFHLQVFYGVVQLVRLHGLDGQSGVHSF